MEMKYFYPHKSALLVIDMQNAFLNRGAPIYVKNGRVLVPKILNLISILRPLGCKIIWTRISLDRMNKGLYKALWPSHFYGNGKNILSKGSHNFQIIDELHGQVLKEDIIIDKYKYSAFIQTNLQSELGLAGIDTLLFAGVTTNVCVESTLRDAFMKNYVPVLLSDCTKTFNRNLQICSEEIVKMAFGYVINSSEILKKIRMKSSSNASENKRSSIKND